MEQHHPGGGVEYLHQAVPLDYGAAGLLVAYIDEVLREHRQFSQQQGRDLCAAISADDDAAAIAKKLTDSEQASNQWQDQRAAALSGVLDSKSMEKLNAWLELDVRKSIGVSEIDYAKGLALPGARDALLARMQASCADTISSVTEP